MINLLVSGRYKWSLTLLDPSLPAKLIQEDVYGTKKTKRAKRACKRGRLTSYQGPLPRFKKMQSTKVLGTRADFNYMVL